MTAVAWTAIGIVAFFQIFMVVYLGRKLDAAEARIDASINRISARVDAHDRNHAR